MMSQTSTNAVAKSMTTAPDSLTHDKALDKTSPQPLERSSDEKKPVAGHAFRYRNHHYSAMPVKHVIKTRMRDLDLTNSDVQRAMGYSRPNVVAMLRTGTMRLPANKVTEVAKLLQVDPVFLLGKVLAENDVALWDVIASIMGDRLITANEMALIHLVRKVLVGHDINLAEVPALVVDVTAALAEIVDRENALIQAAVNAIDGSENQ